MLPWHARPSTDGRCIHRRPSTEHRPSDDAKASNDGTAALPSPKDGTAALVSAKEFCAKGERHGLDERTKENDATVAATSEGELFEETSCVVCMERGRHMIFVPCGHGCCCLHCGLLLKECPLCRVVVTRRLKVGMYSAMCIACMLRISCVCRMYVAACMLHVWCSMHALCMLHVCHMYAACMLHVCRTYACMHVYRLHVACISSYTPDHS